MKIQLETSISYEGMGFGVRLGSAIFSVKIVIGRNTNIELKLQNSISFKVYGELGVDVGQRGLKLKQRVKDF